MKRTFKIVPRAVCLLALFILLSSLAPHGASAPPVHAADAGPSTIYLPLIMRLGGLTIPPPPPPPATSDGAFFVNTTTKTNSAAIAVDAQGGMHLAFTVFVPTAENPPAIYAYCAPQPAGACADSNNWQAVGLSEMVDEVQLALTPAGQPRLLIRKQRVGFNSDEYIYAECDISCTNGDSWSGTVVAQPGGVDVFGKDNPQRSFALDPAGRPRFIYSYGWDGTGHPIGVYYAFCDADCTATDSWQQTQIYSGPIDRSLAFDFPALAFTSAGQPRVVANMSFSGEAQGVLYLACDVGCEAQSGWQALALDERGGGTAASWDIELDSNDQPRIAFYQASTASGSGDQLWYLACDGDCLSAASWRSTTIGLAPTEGQNADLELDAQGRPRLAYEASSPGTLGYAWCNSGCDTPAGWLHRTIETSSQLQTDLPVTKPISCGDQGWFDAIPALALDLQGNPKIAYDAVNVAQCFYDQGPGKPPGSRVEYLWRAVRVNFFAQP